MTSHAKTAIPELSFAQAIETLSYIADMEMQEEGSILFTVPPGKSVESNKAQEAIDWIQTHDVDSNVHRIRDIFRLILSHLKHTYKKESQYVTSKKTIEGIKSIMVLVGEASKKLDQYLQIFQKSKSESITHLKEFKLLQEFYRKKIDHIIDQTILSRWILGLTRVRIPHEQEVADTDVQELAPERSRHIFVDVDSLRKDTEYELLLMRKEDGSRFFNPRLLRNIKLVCDFGSNILSEEGVDPLVDVDLWQDKIYHQCAKTILRSVGNHLDRFIKEAQSEQDMELVADLRKTFMALMLAANARNLAEHDPVKNCYEYFCDFQSYLRNCLQARDYQKLIAYAPNKNDHLANCIVDTIHVICKTIYLNLTGLQEMLSIVEDAVQDARSRYGESIEMSKGLQIWSRLAYDYGCMLKAMRFHPNGPLWKAMHFLEDGGATIYDTLMQHNLPNHWFDLHYGDRKVPLVRTPSPTLQAFINKSVVADEFRGLLHYYDRHHLRKKHLLINLQDRTSWRDHARCVALEQLEKNPRISKYIDVVTLAIDTDFYEQLAPYDVDEPITIFIDQFKEHLSDEASGYTFPPAVKKVLLHSFIDEMLNAVHRVFFDSKEILTVEERREFISIAYIMLLLKLIETIGPSTVSLSCKDGVDVSTTMTGLLFAFLKMMNQEAFSEADLEYLNLILYAPALIVRQRLCLPDVFDRFLNTLRRLDLKKHELKRTDFLATVKKEFGPLFSTPILHASCAF